MTAYDSLKRIFARNAAVEDALGILQWDAQTMLPPGANDGRAEQIAALRLVAHEALTAPRTGELIDAAVEDATALTEWDRANLREMERRRIRAAAVPNDLLEASSRAASRCQHVWQAARKANDFSAVVADLAEVLRTQREIAIVLGEALDMAPYDALLDGFDPGASEASLDALFAPVRAQLPGILAAALERQRNLPPALPVPGPFDPAAQEKLGRKLLAAMGFDLDHGRLDVSAHPFTGGAFGDVRITTRYDEKTFLPSLLAVIHETGHGLYEQGRPGAWMGQPVGESCGMGVHESQSMIFEMQAARCAEFFTYLAPLAREAFGGSGPAWEPQNLRRLVTTAAPGFIRVDADEVTYPAHILVRYGLEKAMMSGDLPIADLPGAFNAAVKELLGLDVPDDRRGCLQDIHWYSGAFGYFPAYLVGAMGAAQLFDAAARQDPALRPALAAGDFAPLRNFVREKIHARGSLLMRDALFAEATGRPLDPGVYLGHLRSRYAEGV